MTEALVYIIIILVLVITLVCYARKSGTRVKVKSKDLTLEVNQHAERSIRPAIQPSVHNHFHLHGPTFIQTAGTMSAVPSSRHLGIKQGETTRSKNDEELLFKPLVEWTKRK